MDRYDQPPVYRDDKTYDAETPPYGQPQGGSQNRQQPYQQQCYRQQPYQQQGYQQQPYQRQPQYQPPNNDGGNNTVKIMLIVAGAVVAIALMVTLVFIFMSGKEDPTPDNRAAGTSSSATTATIAALTNSDGKITMPDLKGLSKEDAISRLSQLGVTVKEIKETETDTVKPGYVFDQVPAKGKTVQKGEEVTLYVAKAKATQPPTTKPVTQPPTTQPKTDPPVASVTYLYCKAEDYVALRTGPGVSYTEIYRIPTGYSMVYLNTSGDWYYVQFGSLRGYVHSAYVSFDPNAAINHEGENYPSNGYTATIQLVCTADDFVSLRTGPNKSYSELARIPRGYTMYFIDYSRDGWLYVKYGSQYGFVYSGYVGFV